MNTRQDHLETLTEIRALMERSSRFRALSSATGITAGVLSLLGLVIAWQQTGMSPFDTKYVDYLIGGDGTLVDDNVRILLVLFFAVFCLAFMAAIYLTKQKATQLGVNLWDHATRKVVYTMALPMASGGIFCLALLYHRVIVFIPAASLIFYGLALIQAARLTLVHVRYLGWAILVLGLLATVFPEQGLIAWGAGFGVAHIVYGISLYFTREP